MTVKSSPQIFSASAGKWEQSLMYIHSVENSTIWTVVGALLAIPSMPVLWAKKVALAEFQAVGFVLLGLSEAVAAPLIWGIRIPLRGFLTLVQGKPALENSARIQAAVEKSETKGEDIKNVYEIHAKLHNGLAKGRVTKVDVAEEQKRWENRNEEDGIANFMQLFKKAEALDDDPLANAEKDNSWSNYLSSFIPKSGRSYSKM